MIEMYDVYYILIMSVGIILPFLLTLFIAFWVYLRRSNQSLADTKKTEILLILGSGGHTTELCLLLEHFQFENCQRIHVVIGSSDKNSEAFFFDSLAFSHKALSSQKIQIHRVMRTNEVKQSLLTTIFTTIAASFKIFCLIIQKLISVTDVVANGPGLCVPFYYIFWFLKKMKLSRVKLIFFESWCRVESLSLTGQIIKPITTNFLVHWEQQAKKFKGCEYYGQLI